MPDDKPASEWTPRDHFVRATELLCNGDINNDYEVIALHIQLAGIPPHHVINTDNEILEDYRP